MAKPIIDAIDRKILTILQSDAHATSDEISREVGLSPSPCARRVRNLEEVGVIKSYVAVVDQVKVGLPISVFASIKLERQREEELDRFAKAVQRWPEIVEAGAGVFGNVDNMVVLNGAEGVEDMLAKALTLGGTGLGVARQLLSTMNGQRSVDTPASNGKLVPVETDPDKK